MKLSEIPNLREYTTNTAEDFVGTHLITGEQVGKFIEQVLDYAENCCETEQELLCFIDGLLMNFYEEN
jgi:hypothetical protein